jgi:hypothetical protein
LAKAATKHPGLGATLAYIWTFLYFITPACSTFITSVPLRYVARFLLARSTGFWQNSKTKQKQKKRASSFSSRVHDTTASRTVEQHGHAVHALARDAASH